MKLFKWVPILLGAIFSISIISSPPLHAEVKDKYVIIGMSTDPGGFKKGSFESLLTSLLGALNKRTGVEFVYRQVDNEDKAYEMLKKGEADFVFTGMDYCRARDAGAPIVPWAILQIQGRKTYKECLYVPNGSSIKSVKDMKGKYMIVPNHVNESLKIMLADDGITAKIKDFFGRLGIYENPLNALELLLQGKVDVLMIGDTYMTFLLFDEKFKGKFRSAACGPEITPTLLLRRRDIDQGLMDKLNQAMTNAHQDPAFKDLKFLFLATQGKMVLVTEKDFETNCKKYEYAKKMGWLDELKALRRNIPVIKPQ